jgi:23S rRNA-/tRNA-specific pseudouridylate synthase
MSNDINKSTNIDNKLKCRNCSEIFVSRNALFRHCRDCNSDDEDNITKKTKSTNNVIEISSLLTDFKIKTLQEDDWFRIIIKPQGMSTMGGKEETLVNSDQMLLPNALVFMSGVNYKKAIPCHRLDAATGGLMICSKSLHAEKLIKTCFRDKLVKKVYRAIVSGKIEKEEDLIVTDKGILGKESITRYKVLSHTRSKQYGWVTTVDLYPITGKRHQLRRHMLYIGHAIIGDNRYSFANNWPNNKKFSHVLFLWALQITFPHPFSLLEYRNKMGIIVNDSISYDEDNDDNDINNTVNNFNEIKDCSWVNAILDEPNYYNEFKIEQENEWNSLIKK